jgi:hypothetical protein
MFAVNWDEPGLYGWMSPDGKTCGECGIRASSRGCMQTGAIRPGPKTVPVFYAALRIDRYGAEFSSLQIRENRRALHRVSQLALKTRSENGKPKQYGRNHAPGRSDPPIRAARREEIDVQVGMQTAISLGATLLGAFLGKAFSSSTVGSLLHKRTGIRTAKERRYCSGF